jgi:type I restriction enzyme R subunit
MNKKSLSERDICTKFITPSLKKAGWDIQKQIREEVFFTDGRIIVQGALHTRGTRKRADYILYYKNNVPLAIIEAKDNKKGVGSGMQQALEYSEILQLPFVFTSNGNSFVFHDKTNSEIREKEIPLDEFPSPATLWEKYLKFTEINTPKAREIVEQDYFVDDSGMNLRYYQANAVNRTIEAIAKGQNRVLLVMATYKLTKILFGNSLRKSILSDLNKMGINETFLFPDLSKICEKIIEDIYSNFNVTEPNCKLTS